MEVEEPGADSVADTELTNKAIFDKIDVLDNVYIRQKDDNWKMVIVQHKHSSKPRFMAGNEWFDIDVKTMTLDKPDGFVAPRKRASSHGDISTINQSSGVSFSNRTTYGPTRMYRPRYMIPEKPPHGFAGLKNQGATCYLNSLLQTLYMTMELREALFQWEYDEEQDGDDKSKCMTLQLQELFARLQASRQGAATTSALTKSFGWSGSEVYQQHDVVELMQVLFDFMAEKAHNEALKNVVQQFRCECLHYVECLEHGDRRERQQPLVGIPLALTEANTLDEAFRKYLEFEVLEGDNLVMNEVVGRKTRSKKGVAFSQFGQFISVQLGRWELNLRTFQREKIQKPIEFGLELDVAPYINSPDPIPYELYSMMIHRGGAYGGHYYAYIKDFKTGKWFEFNDSTVTEIPDEEFQAMMDISYCKEEKRNYRARTSPLVGAYMLMYRRVDDDPKTEVPNDVIPAELREVIVKDDEKWVQKRTEFCLRIKHEDKIEDVVFDRNETFGSQVEKVLKEFGLKDVATEDVRFRSQKMGSKARVFENIDESFTEIGIDDGDAIFMEVKKPGEDFEEVAVDWVRLKIIGLDYNSDSMEPTSLGEIKVDKQGKTSQIRVECAKLLGVGVRNCKIYCRYDRDGDPDLEPMDWDTFDVEQVSRHLVEIWTDKCNDWEQDESTPIYEVFEEKKHFINLEFNLPGTTEFTESIPIDDRRTVREVREMIGKHLNIDPMSFIVGRKFSQEIKELDKQICRCFISQRRLFLRKGTPLTDGQFRVELCLDSGEEGEERFTPLRNHFVIHKDWKMEDFHAALVQAEEADQSDTSEIPPVELMRLRKKFREHMTEFVPEEGTMNNLIGLSDGFQIVIQKLDQPNKLKRADLILRIIRYRPKKRSCDVEEHEIVVPRKTLMNQLGAEGILPVIGDAIPLEHLQWGKANMYPKNLQYVKWKDSQDEDSRTLHKSSVKNGMVIVYRDGREVDPEDDEEEDVRAAEVGSQGGSGRHWRAGGGAASSRYRPKERGIKIFSVQEQEERSANKRVD